MPLGYEAANFWSHQPSQTTAHSRRSRRSSSSSMADAMMTFVSQVTSSFMALADKTVQLADQHRQDAAQREESVRQEAMHRDELLCQEAARREESVHQEALVIRQEALEREKLAVAREQMLAQVQKEAEEKNPHVSSKQRKEMLSENSC